MVSLAVICSSYAALGSKVYSLVYNWKRPAVVIPDTFSGVMDGTKEHSRNLSQQCIGSSCVGIFAFYSWFFFFLLLGVWCLH